MTNPNKPTSERRKFDKTFKAEALRMLDEGQTATQVAKTLNVSDQLLHTWKHAHKKQTLKQAGNNELIAENERLKAQLKRAETERDILKKSARRNGKRSLLKRPKGHVSLHSSPKSELSRSATLPSPGGGPQWLL